MVSQILTEKLQKNIILFYPVPRLSSVGVTIVLQQPEQIAFSIFAHSNLLLFVFPDLCGAVMETAALLLGTV